MNGKLQQFVRGTLNLPDRFDFINMYADKGMPTELINENYNKLLTDEIWVNNEYQVNIDKNPPHGFKGIFNIWHLSIKRKNKESIHDWRDLQQIKNMLVGEEYEAIELYPAESRKQDSANQYHLWVFVKDVQSGEIPHLPVGWGNRVVTDESINGSNNRAF